MHSLRLKKKKKVTLPVLLCNYYHFGALTVHQSLCEALDIFHLIPPAALWGGQ